jgi:hypothetical protein
VKSKGKRFKHNIIVIAYDFDGTLTPQPMQEYTILPEIGIKGKKFWNEVKKESKKTRGEEIVTYMRLMLRRSDEKNFPITRKMLGSLADKIKFYAGVTTYFDRINEYVKNKTEGNIRLRHYVISSGLKEILNRVKIKKHFHKIFASEYWYDHYGAAKFPLIVVNDTLKTQFLFRINKGKENLDESINEYMPLIDRPVPFQNILYIGDGLTDVPCMTVTTKQGGYAIAVYKPYSSDGKGICQELLTANRVDMIAKADYSKDTELESAIKIILDTMIQGVYINDMYYHQYIRYLKDKGDKSGKK